MDFLQSVSEAVRELIGSAGYFGIFFAAFVETVFPPLPSELIMPFGGFLAGRGDLGYVGVVVAGTLGSVAGAIPMYYIGVWAEGHVVRRLLRRYGRWFAVSEDRLDRALATFRELLLAEGAHFDLVRSASSAAAALDALGEILPGA